MKNNITNLLNIKESGLKIFFKNNNFFGIFSKNKVKCPCCSSKNVVKNGFRTTYPKIPYINNTIATIELQKQKYICKDCKHHFSLSPNFVEKHKTFSKATTLNIIEELKYASSLTDISKRNKVSISKVSRVLRDCEDMFLNKKVVLPEHLAFDETMIADKLSFVFSDAENKKLQYILENRKNLTIKDFFLSIFTYEELKAVKTVTIDIFKPYMSIIKEIFPNAEIILDNFHIVQNITRAFNNARISIMKSFKKGSHEYLLFKNFWKLFLKDSSKLNYSKRTYIRKLKRYLTSDELIEYTLNFSDELSELYSFLQSFYSSFHNKDSIILKSLLDDAKNNDIISKYLKTQIKTSIEYFEYIQNSFKHNYNNGHLEGINNKIKTLKKVSYGFKNFCNARTRIFLHFGVVL